MSAPAINALSPAPVITTDPDLIVVTKFLERSYYFLSRPNIEGV